MDSWNKTPDDLKPIIEEVCSNPFRTSGGLTREVYKVMMEEIASTGVELYTLPPEGLFPHEEMMSIQKVRIKLKINGQEHE